MLGSQHYGPLTASQIALRLFMATPLHKHLQSQLEQSSNKL